jgi:hypothetical protein
VRPDGWSSAIFMAAMLQSAHSRASTHPRHHRA